MPESYPRFWLEYRQHGCTGVAKGRNPRATSYSWDIDVFVGASHARDFGWNIGSMAAIVQGCTGVAKGRSPRATSYIAGASHARDFMQGWINRYLMQNNALPTPVSMGIIISCAVVFLLRNISPSLALWPLEGGYFQAWQPFTYAFLHGSFNHLFFNMFAVWMFGTPLENSWGSLRYANFYIACILGAAAAQIIVQMVTGGQYPTIGASGGVFGLLLAYGVMWPNNRLFLLFFPVPIKAKWFVLIYGAAELLFGITGTMPGIAHFAHLGGMVLGAAVLWKWGWRPGMTWQK